MSKEKAVGLVCVFSLGMLLACAFLAMQGWFNGYVVFIVSLFIIFYGLYFSGITRRSLGEMTVWFILILIIFFTPSAKPPLLVAVLNGTDKPYRILLAKEINTHDDAADTLAGKSAFFLLKEDSGNVKDHVYHLLALDRQGQVVFHQSVGTTDVQSAADEGRYLWFDISEETGFSNTTDKDK